MDETPGPRPALPTAGAVDPYAGLDGWRQASSSVSLPEAHGTIPVPDGGSFWRKLFAFAGPGYLVAVGYMDPGNWATDLAGGSRYGYTLISVIMLSNLMAILLQALSARLGIVSGRDLAQPAVRAAALLGGVPDRPRRAARAVSPAVPVPLRRSAGGAADPRHCR